MAMNDSNLRINGVKLTMKSKMQNNEGFGLLAIVVAVAVVALIGFGGWYVWQARMKNSQTTQTTIHNQTNTTNNQGSAQLAKVTFLNGQLQTVLPSGWTKSDDTTVTQVIDGKTFEMGFSVAGYNAGAAPTGSIDPTINIDPLAINWQASTSDAVPFSVLKAVTTTKGTTLYVVETPDHQVSVSTCQPTQFKACSIKVNGAYIYSLLAHHEPTDQTQRELDFNDPDTTKALDDFIVVVQNLNI